MIKILNHSDHLSVSRLMTVVAETAEQQQSCASIRQYIQQQQGIRQCRALSGVQFEQQLLVVDRLNGMPVATVGLSSSHTGGEVEGEFDLRDLMPGKTDYLELDGPVMLTGHNPEEVLSQCLGFIKQSYGNAMPQALVSRISLPLGGGDKYIQSLMFYLRNSHMCSSLARPRVALRRGDVAYADDVILPGILRAFMRRGACIGSEPYWDAERGRAVILVWFRAERLVTQALQQPFAAQYCPATQLSV